jgi:hypothetical protein
MELVIGTLEAFLRFHETHSFVRHNSAWREIEELFGCEEYEEFLDLTTLVVGEDEDKLDSVQARPKEVKLTDVYEPSEIASKMLTEKDDIIRMRDIPERMQVRPTDILMVGLM